MAFFSEIEIKDSKLLFKSDSSLLFSLELNAYPHFEMPGDFKNYYVLSRGQQWVELYFP